LGVAQPESPLAPTVAPRASAGQPEAAQQAPLDERALLRRGSLWSLGGYGAAQILRFAGNLVLTRLLVPEAFGRMALVGALQQGLQLFSDIGIGASIIQGARGDQRDFLDTAWTVQILRGALLSALAAALAWPFARFYDDPALAWVVVVSGSTALISGFNSTRLYSMYRRVDLARVSLIEVASQAAGLAAILVWAAFERSIWALVAGGIAGSLARLALSHGVLPGARDRLRWEPGALASMVHRGRWIFFSTVLTFLVGQSDRLVFGKLVPLSMLGVYSVGTLIASLPAIALGRMASSVFFPLYSRAHNAGEDLAPIFARVRRPLLLAGGWMIAGLAGGGTAAVRLLYDERYAQAGWIVQCLALASWFTVLEATNGAALLARGQARSTAASGGAKLLGMLALIPLGYALADFPGAVAGLALSELLRYAFSVRATSRAGLRGWPLDLGLTAWVFASAFLGWLTAELAARAGAGRALGAGLVFLVVTLAWAPLAERQRRNRPLRSTGSSP